MAVEGLTAGLLQALGEDPDREGLKRTPVRVARAWEELTSGYAMDPAEILTTDFSADGYDSMVMLTDIEFYSTCEHHLMPFFGRAHVGYLPRFPIAGRIVGISKLARLVDCYARRLQIQERMSHQILSAMMKHLDPLGAGVVVEATHLCMRCRGVQKQNSTMLTSALGGDFREDPATRAEFLGMIRRR
jgi:GTP cyclohydrolase I